MTTATKIPLLFHIIYVSFTHHTPNILFLFLHIHAYFCIFVKYFSSTFVLFVYYFIFHFDVFHHYSIDLFFRIAVLAEQTGTKQSLFVAENMRALAVSKPKTVAQAMQLTLIMYNIQTNLDSTIVRSLGGIDHIYYPF